MKAIDAWLDRVPHLRDATPPVVVGCSGGSDSLALLALAQSSGLLPIAVHVDHGLRMDSARDAEIVRRTAARLGTRSRTTRVRVEQGPNLEARARAARYSILENVRHSLGATAVLIGHTMDDQAETVLLNLLRGAGSAGLGGMAPRSGRIVRPMLGLRRSETDAICSALGFDPVHDPMNDDRAFRRVWVRSEVLPVLSDGARRDLVPVLARQADLLRDESTFLDALAAAHWPTDTASAADLAALPPVLARRAVRCWLGVPPPRLDEVEAVLGVARRERRAVDLAGGRRVWRTRGVMHHGTTRRVRDYGVGA